MILSKSLGWFANLLFGKKWNILDSFQKKEEKKGQKKRGLSFKMSAKNNQA